MAAARRRGEPPPRLQIIEAAHEPGGYCRTVRRSGFVWDYSGHFFHFTRPELEQFLRQRMPGQDVREIERRALIRYRGRDIDYPFQANIHQLAHEDFLDCLVDLYAAARAGGAEPRSFQELVLQRLGRGISDRFLLPYNEKLYACDLDTLDPSAMGRFLPLVDLDSVMSNLRPPAAGRAASRLQRHVHLPCRRRHRVRARAPARSGSSDAVARRAARPGGRRAAGRRHRSPPHRLHPPGQLSAAANLAHRVWPAPFAGDVRLQRGRGLQPGI
ncbi:MAG: NAD(P)-binding protein [Myxococcales bacterium]|nr:NAD(P)-binding protein [Myxococcales bacterium]